MVEVTLRVDAQLGEGPTWDSGTNTLLWVDILGSAVHRYNPSTGTDEVTATPQHVGAVDPRESGGLVLNLRDGVALLDPDGSLHWLVDWAKENMPGHDKVRGNDAVVDPAGRLWAGTMAYDAAPGAGWLARVDPDGTTTVVLDDVTISNGIGWSPDSTLMYYVDSPTRRIDVFDYDVATGEATGRRPLCAVADTEGVPDGLCVDADGCVWVALHGGSAVRRYTPDGRLDREIPLPTPRPTACCFGGENLTDLYITTARQGLSEEELTRAPLAGSLFVLPDAGVGKPCTPFAG